MPRYFLTQIVFAVATMRRSFVGHFGFSLKELRCGIGTSHTEGYEVLKERATLLFIRPGRIKKLVTLVLETPSPSVRNVFLSLSSLFVPPRGMLG